MHTVIRELSKKYPVAVMAVLISFIIMIKLLQSALFAFQQSNYTEMKGTVVEKYTERESVGRHRRVGRRRTYVNTGYLCVRYIDNQEEKMAEGLKANFWEAEGSTIRFYITPDGRAVRNTIMDNKDLYLFGFIAAALIVLFIKRKAGQVGEEKAVPVGIVVDDYDFIPGGENAETSNTFQKSTANETVPDKEPERLKMPSTKPSFELYTEEEFKNRK